MSRKRILKTAELLALALWGISAFGQGIDANVVKSRTGMSSSRSQRAGEIEVPNRPASSLFQGEQGKQRSEIHYDQTTGVVTIKMVVQDPNGYFIPNIRRDNFAVYENNVRQQNATVEIDHAPVTLAVLLEYGGRRQALNTSVWNADRRGV